jgi:hypothetical protein
VEAWASPHLEAHVAYLRHLGTPPGDQARASGDVYAVRTGVRSNSENAVVSCAGARVTRASAEELAEWFAEWGVPASWLCAEGEGRAATVATLEAAGDQVERSAWEMQARIDDLDLDVPAPLRHYSHCLHRRRTARRCMRRWASRAVRNRRIAGSTRRFADP